MSFPAQATGPLNSKKMEFVILIQKEIGYHFFDFNFVNLPKQNDFKLILHSPFSDFFIQKNVFQFNGTLRNSVLYDIKYFLIPINFGWSEYSTLLSVFFTIWICVPSSNEK